MGNNPSIVAIVEGPGEKDAVPGLIRRILYEHLKHNGTYFDMKTIRANGKSNITKKGGLEKFIEYALLENCAAILVLLDADDKCPLEKSANLVARVVALNLNVPVAIVYAKSEYETWFISSLSQGVGRGIRQRLGISESVNSPDNVEALTSAKGWLTRNMPIGRSYRETIDQANLTHHIDLDLVHGSSRSFRRLCHAVEELILAIDNCTPIVTPHHP